MKRGATRDRPAVQWRDGVHLVGTPLWCDARRAREACFVSSALVPAARRHRQLIGTAETLSLLDSPVPGLAVPYGRPFTLGSLRLELFPSGHALGAASLSVQVAGSRVVYAGTVSPSAWSPLAAPAEVRACDVLVVDATYGSARFAFPAADDAMTALRAWIDETLADGATPVLLATPLSGGLELARALGADRSLRAHRAFVDAARKARSLGRSLPPLHRFAGPPAQGEVVLWPAAHRDAAAVASIRRGRVAAVGAFAADPRVQASLRADAAFALADCADHETLVRYIVETHAAHVYLLHAEDDLLKLLTRRGLDARPLGPPMQLGLF